MNIKEKMFKLFLIIALIVGSSCKAQLDGTYRSIPGLGSEKNANSAGEIIKKFKNGKIEQHTIDKHNKILTFVGKYETVNDSIYAEFIDYDFYGYLKDKMYLMKYKIHKDTLIQTGEVYHKIKGPQNAYYRIPVKVYWLKID